MMKTKFITFILIVVSGIFVKVNAQDTIKRNKSNYTSQAELDRIAVYKTPEYEGGQQALYNDIGTLFNTHGAPVGTYKIYITFTIEKDGTISDVVAKTDPGYGMGDEAIRVMNNLPKKFSPGENKLGDILRVGLALPITINVEKPTEKKD